MTKSYGTETFKKKAIAVHGSKFDYTHTVYTKAKAKNNVKITCKTCGKTFEQRASRHLSGKGCNNKICVYEKIKENTDYTSRTKDKKQFIEEAITIHNKNYDYSLVNYVNAATKVRIKCNRCNNVFSQRPSSHLQGRGCNLKSCMSHKFSQRKTRVKSTKKFIKDAHVVHGN